MTESLVVGIGNDEVTCFIIKWLTMVEHPGVLWEILTMFILNRNSKFHLMCLSTKGGMRPRRSC